MVAKKQKTHVTLDRHQRVLKELEKAKENITRLDKSLEYWQDVIERKEAEIGQQQVQIKNQRHIQFRLNEELNRLRAQIGQVVYKENDEKAQNTLSMSIPEDGLIGVGFPVRPGELINITARVELIHFDRNKEPGFINFRVYQINRVDTSAPNFEPMGFSKEKFDPTHDFTGGVEEFLCPADDKERKLYYDGSEVEI